MSRKSKGCNAERELIHLFWNNGWSAARIAGSGCSRYPAPDVIAGNNLRKLAIECKATKDIRQYLTKKEVLELGEFSKKFGAEPWIGIRFNNMDWLFFTPEDLKETDEAYGIKLDQAKLKGLKFEDLIELQ